VRDNIHKMELKTNDTFSLIQKSNTIFAQQENAVINANKIFEEIVHSLKSVDSDLGDINKQAKDMQALKDNTVEIIMNIAAVTEESAASSEQVSALSSEQQEAFKHLSSLSAQLTSSMNALNSSIQTFTL